MQEVIRAGEPPKGDDLSSLKVLFDICSVLLLNCPDVCAFGWVTSAAQCQVGHGSAAVLLQGM